MLRIAHEAINPLLNQYNCPEINLRIGASSTTTTTKKEQQHLLEKRPVYDLLSYTLSIAVKMTALAHANHIVIGDPMSNLLDDKQRSAFQPINISPDIWDYVAGIVRRIYVAFIQMSKVILFPNAWAL
jgi:adenylate cyclase